MSGLTFSLCNTLFYNGLCCNTSMIITGVEQYTITFHTMITNQCILNGNCQSMSDMQSSSNIWRWSWNNKSTFGIVGICFSDRSRCEKFTLFPPFEPRLFNVIGIISCFHWLRKIFLLSRLCVINIFWFTFHFLLCFFLLFCSRLSSNPLCL